MISVICLLKSLVSGNMYLLFIHHIKEGINIIQIMTLKDLDIMVIILSCISCLHQIPKHAKIQRLISGVVIVRDQHGFYCTNNNIDAHEWYKWIKNHHKYFGHISAPTVFRGKYHALGGQYVHIRTYH